MAKVLNFTWFRHVWYCFAFDEYLFFFLLNFQDAADNDLSEEGDELDFDNDDDNDDVDELALSFNDVEVLYAVYWGLTVLHLKHFFTC